MTDTKLTPSVRIKRLVDGHFKQPYIRDALKEVNQEVIALEVQIKALQDRNIELEKEVSALKDLAKRQNKDRGLAGLDDIYRQ